MPESQGIVDEEGLAVSNIKTQQSTAGSNSDMAIHEGNMPKSPEAVDQEGLVSNAEAVQESSGSFESTPFLDSHGSNESE